MCRSVSAGLETLCDSEVIEMSIFVLNRVVSFGEPYLLIHDGAPRPREPFGRLLMGGNL